MHKMMRHLKAWSRLSADNDTLSPDLQQQRLRKSVLMLLSASCTILGIFWGIAYIYLERPLAGCIPLGYSVLSAGSLVYYWVSKRYKFFCRTQLFLILILPFLLQWGLGGFAASGSVVIWSILAPTGALMFAGPNRAVAWFVVYLLLVTLSGFLDGWGDPNHSLPPTIAIVSFGMNIAAVSAIVFFLLKFFVQSREQAMTELASEHRKVRQSLSLAMEVQQNLLPRGNPSVRGLDIAARSVYCDETGGDYFDFPATANTDAGVVRVVVGDVSDHGIPSALLMATARAFIRQRSSQPGTIADIVTAANRQLAGDVEDSGRFMTLFYAEIDRQNNRMHWLNAGHEPATVYDPDSHDFVELHGEGSLPLGISDDFRYTQAQLPIAPGQIIVIATDGIQEAQNRYGEFFGKQAYFKVIRQNAGGGAADILKAVFDAVDLFRYGSQAKDDATLMVVKVVENS